MHLLVIEDDRRLARVLERLLGADHHVVELAATAREGLELADVGRFDALILDIGLPDRLRPRHRPASSQRGVCAPILVLTARDSVHDRVNGLDAGADDYLLKPFA